MDCCIMSRSRGGCELSDNHKKTLLFVSSFSIDVEYIRGFKCPHQKKKKLKNRGPANVGAAPVKLFSCMYRYELTSPPFFFFEGGMEDWSFSKQFSYTLCLYYPLFSCNVTNRTTDESPKRPKIFAIWLISNTLQSLKYTRRLYLEHKTERDIVTNKHEYHDKHFIMLPCWRIDPQTTVQK